MGNDVDSATQDRDRGALASQRRFVGDGIDPASHADTM